MTEPNNASLNAAKMLLQNETVEDEANFQAFKKFVLFFSQLFSEPGFLDTVPCRDSYKSYVPEYYASIFGSGIREIRARHLKWFRRLAPLFAQPKGTTIVDYGGGYGLDAIFLASLGYRVVFFEITPHHIAIARHLALQYAQPGGHGQVLPIEFVLAGTDKAPQDMDAVLFNEVAHHIEPVDQAFDAAAAMLRPGGQLFLLEPNYLCPAVQAYFFKVRGFRTVEKRTDAASGQSYLYGNENIRPVSTWHRHARAAGFSPSAVSYVIPWRMRGEMHRPSSLRQRLERLPLTRHLLASHVMLRYQRT